ncbi:uncharacterized protein AMSG_10471 [Thecamonas trahens ATCC 50062]|uniref:UvrD-like helicase C-terminal domain-containing protein n=1 Tax=Thecamonas trahens ATCC 50062 TaxID=461836 RepID=A0A0L0DQ85_THETB|nr:hypothetical protein AMSG_10471 [Thecamonas trahens ATCC 50062]KNC54474.1 hypothetical protein AMSG_10471 [Thecamonas trahens ATCC 50062]|eukprot:XP_013753629.1 hypothetical protein AMSG_10471 [Thecamonas trahens ATCC 50062]
MPPFDSNTPLFGGANVVFVGDLAQLAPVLAHPVYIHFETDLSTRQRAQRAARLHNATTEFEDIGVNLWAAASATVVILKINNRARSDPAFAHQLAVARNGNFAPNGSVAKLIRSRTFATAADRAKAIATALTTASALDTRIIVCSNAARVAWYTTIYARIAAAAHAAEAPPPIMVEAVISIARSPPRDSTRNLLLRLPGSSATCYYDMRVPLAIGTPVMFIDNIATSAAICNGTTGIVVGVVFPDNVTFVHKILSRSVPNSVVRIPNTLPAVVYVDVPSLRGRTSHLPGVPDTFPTSVVAVVPRAASGCRLTVPSANRTAHAPTKINFSLRQLPIVAAFTSTVHKVQGTSLSVAIIPAFAEKTISPNATLSAQALYVAMSRARTSSGLIFFQSPTFNYLNRLKLPDNLKRELQRTTANDVAPPLTQ